MKSKNGVNGPYETAMSPPSRGAWIEICISREYCSANGRRPPRGGRGLKYSGTCGRLCGGFVAPLAGGVD